VQEILGHSTVTLTLGTYSHVIPALKRDAADRMDAILAPGATNRVAVSRPPRPPAGRPSGVISC
jgi:integrase